MKRVTLARMAVVAGLAAGIGFAANQALVAQSTPAPARPGADPLIEATRVKYGFAEWAKGTRRVGLPLAELEIAGLRGRDVIFHAGGVSRRFDDASGIGRVLVELMVADDVAGAHEEVLRQIAFVQSTKTLPSAASRGIAAGDVGWIGYGGRDGSRIAWLAFASGNLALRVKNLDPDAAGSVDVAPIVTQVSEFAARQPALSEGVVLPRPQIARFAPAANQVVAGESLALDLSAKEFDGRPAAVDFIVGGAGQGQGYVEQDDQGTWRFHATGAGALDLTLEARSRFGTLSRQTVRVTITR
jgi:hypothetical protein